MKKNIVIKVENLNKKYIIGKHEKHLTLRDKLVELPKNLFKVKKKREFWVLKKINFRVKKGEVLGIIGKNGAGKSTLLKILSRITEPTDGKIVIKGRTASLLEVGTGFSPELTGKENIYLNGSILGMKKKEIDDRIDSIIKFSGVKRFLDTPVKRYSSGMFVRLAFAVAAHLEPDIMLVDEVLAVGDIGFQKKSLQKIKSIVNDDSRTVIFVSHNLEAIREICPTTIYMKNGKIQYFGKTSKAIQLYSRDILPKKNKSN